MLFECGHGAFEKFIDCGCMQLQILWEIIIFFPVPAGSLTAEEETEDMFTNE